jgi:NADH dehydrogenase
MRADINDEDAVATAVAGAYGVVNAVSLYLERGTETYHTLHVEAAERLARQARHAGVERLVHVSGIGADITSGSLYIRRRGEGELAVQAAFANAIIMRPAVMFGPDDAFLNTLVKLLNWLPAYPMFGRGLTRLQPVDVEDVAEAIAGSLHPTARNPVTYELGGPRVYTFEELLKAVAEQLGKHPILFSIPFPIWHSLARVMEMLPGPPLSRNQVELMEVDTVGPQPSRPFKWRCHQCRPRRCRLQLPPPAQVAQAFLVAHRAGAHRASATQIFLKSAFFTDD